MYQDYFGLNNDPFAMTPDPGVMQMTGVQREALAGMTYAIVARKGFVALLGEAGTGKTTLINKLRRALTITRAKFSVVLNPTLSPAEFLECVLADFGVNDIPQSKTQRLLLLQDLLLKADEGCVRAVLIVDEAHKLTHEVLEEIRLFGNFERPDGKLLQIILAGQPELGDVLDRVELQQLKQRIAVRLRIGRLSRREVECYIAHRWKAAGGKQIPFAPAAVERIAKYSHGIPRVINTICDNALLLAMSDGVPVATEDHVEEAARDLSFTEARQDGISAVAATQLPSSVSGQRATPPADPVPILIPTLERYDNGATSPSVLGRLLGKLGWAQ